MTKREQAQEQTNKGVGYWIFSLLTGLCLTGVAYAVASSRYTLFWIVVGLYLVGVTIFVIVEKILIPTSLLIIRIFSRSRS